MQESTTLIIKIVIAGSLFFLLGGGFLFLYILMYNQRKKRHVEEKKEMEYQFRQEVLQTQLEIQEQTLANVAQEIHDNTGQLLSLIKLNIATTDVAQPEKAKVKLDDTLALVTQVMGGIRQLSHTLDTGFVERLGLQAAIAHQLDLVKKTDALHTQLEVTGQPERADAQKELICFRMVQESLNNILKHARAQNIKVSLRYQPQQLRIVITDDGVGFDTAAASGGIGLSNLQNRARMIGAVYHLQSEPGKGTVITIELPL
jgi:two-component system, NarL family, sensor kinase